VKAPAIAKPANKAAAKSADKAMTKPADKAAVKPADKVAVKPVDKAVAKPADKVAAKATGKKQQIRLHIDCRQPVKDGIMNTVDFVSICLKAFFHSIPTLHLEAMFHAACVSLYQLMVALQPV